MLYCFLDTNICQEFRPIKEIDWLKELNATNVCLVVTSVVVRELDQHKAGNSNRLRKRARKVISFLKSLDRQADNEIAPHVTLRFDLIEPKRCTLDEHNLSADVNDDLLVAKALEFRSLHKTENAAILTDDAVVQFKAEGYGLDAPVQSENHRLPHEIDPLVKENQELRIEVEKLKNARPKLEIGFRNEDGSAVGAIKLERGTFDMLTNEETIQETIRTEHERQKDPWNRRNDEFGLPRFGLSMPTTDLAREYRNDLNRWLNNDFRNYLIRKSRYRACRSQNIVLPLLLKNSGSAPAKGTRVEITVRGCRAIYDQMPAAPAKPSAPRLGDYIGLNPNAKRWVHSAGMYLHQMQYDETPIELETGDEHQLRFSIDKILHHTSVELGDHIVVIDKPSKYPVVVELEYRVIAENHPDMLEDKLKLIIQQEEA